MKKTHSIGICLGASTISVVELDISHDPKVVRFERLAHEGDPKSKLKEILTRFPLDNAYVALTGRKFRRITKLPSITEPEATEIAYRYLVKKHGNKHYDAIVSAGGETFMVYGLDQKGRISSISSGNKCASGTGEFFLQQIRRMNLSVEDAIRYARESKHPHNLSSRCSVFAKSDCTHALNIGVPIPDVAAGLSRMMAKKIEELLVKINAKRAIIVGGTAQNGVMIEVLREGYEEIYVPEEAPYFEAYGAALWAWENKATFQEGTDHIFKEHHSSFTFLSPLSDYQDMVEFKTMERGVAEEGDECILGLDVGSTTTKAVLLRTKDDKILAAVYLRTNGNPIEASKNCYRGLSQQLGGKRVKIIGLGVTGSGRHIAGLHAETDGIINEIIAHARAAAHFDPEVDTIFEIGGQDAKYTYLVNGVASDYAMNEACSAGTGSFLEESAYESMGVKTEEIADIALKSKRPPNFSDQCAAFISSDIKIATQEGIEKEDIIAGLVYSICMNYVNRVKGARQVGNKIFMQGGVCYNRAVPLAMASLTGKKIIVPPEPGLMGAYGVALEIKEMLSMGFLKPSSYDLEDLASREIEYGKTFICQGKPENCDRKCEIAMIKVKGKMFPFGGACNKYYNQIHHIQVDTKSYDYVLKRRELLFKTFCEPKNLPENAPVVGINKSFHTHTLYPFYYNFFTELGCKVILPEEVRQSGIDKGMTSFCLSGQIALGMFEDLLEKKPDYIFSPQIMEMHVTEQPEYRKEYQTVCMFVQGEPYYQQATFLKDHPNPPKMLTPVLNFMRGFHTEEEQFVKLAQEMGFSAADGRRAHRVAYEKQKAFFQAMKEEGRKVLKELEKDPTKIAIVLFGHPYNAFAEEANKGIPFKFASRGIYILPYDFLEYEKEENYRNTYWEMGQRIIRAARIVKNHPQLFGVYFTNFLCAIDSMMVTHFRDLMGTKPSLTLEVDTHTADAGVNTRVEAFLDVVRNYIKLRDKITDAEPVFRRAETRINEWGHVEYVDSTGEVLPYRHPSIKAVVPSMGESFAAGAAAALRRVGWNAEPLPVCDREALNLGRSVTTSKECLPIINILGEVLKYIKYRENPEERLVVFIVEAGGCCRVGQYKTLLERMIDKLQLRNVAVLGLSNDNGYAGLGIPFRLHIARAVYLMDVMDDIKAAIKAMAVDRESALKIYQEEFEKLIAVIDGSRKRSFYGQLKESAKRLSQIKLVRPISEAKYIGVVGEIFVRRDHFSLMGIPEKLAEHGFVMLDAPVTEWVRYTDFLRDINMFELKTNLVGRIEAAISDYVQDYHERRIKRILAKTGLYEYELINIREYMKRSQHFFRWELTGEPGLSSGAALAKLVDKYCGVINVGPFGCMNSRMTEAVATREMSVEGKREAEWRAGNKEDYEDLAEYMDKLPFLSIELDGNPFSQIIEARFETFLLQAERLYQWMQERKKRKQEQGKKKS